MNKLDKFLFENLKVIQIANIYEMIETNTKRETIMKAMQYINENKGEKYE